MEPPDALRGCGLNAKPRRVAGADESANTEILAFDFAQARMTAILQIFSLV
jgi:hypothetical protein